MESPREDATGGERFAYFMVRVHVRVPAEPATIAGVVERLGTGRKSAFPDGPGLLRLLTEWSHAPAKMRAAGESGNEAEPDTGDRLA